jgi:hypothetical protein
MYELYDLPCKECPVFAICNSRSTEHLLDCGTLMNYILEDVSDRVEIGIRIEVLGELFKRDYMFDIEEIYSTPVGRDVETSEYFLVIEAHKNADNSVYMIHETVSF